MFAIPLLIPLVSWRLTAARNAPNHLIIVNQSGQVIRKLKVKLESFAPGRQLPGRLATPNVFLPAEERLAAIANGGQVVNTYQIPADATWTSLRLLTYGQNDDEQLLSDRIFFQKPGELTSKLYDCDGQVIGALGAPTPMLCIKRGLRSLIFIRRNPGMPALTPLFSPAPSCERNAQW